MRFKIVKFGKYIRTRSNSTCSSLSLDAIGLRYRVYKELDNFNDSRLQASYYSGSTSFPSHDQLIRNTFIDFVFNYGAESNLGGNFIIDRYIGFGLGYRDINSYIVSPYTGLANVEPSLSQEGSYVTPLLAAGIKIGFRIKK